MTNAQTACAPHQGAATITGRIDPPDLLKIPQMVNVSIAAGSRIIHISGQTAVDADGKVVGATHLDQCRHTLRNLRTALATYRNNWGYTLGPGRLHSPRCGQAMPDAAVPKAAIRLMASR